jgi:hypothetical protein
VDEEKVDAEKPDEALDVASKLKEIGTKWVFVASTEVIFLCTN